ncbi:hypothetical protein FNV43_RR11267 [Rhamnella rubrinervis]|uniref:PGG domain-containing protein n=1 Tax=Rhamnella rubrinervis TaxID=2594499 RepID=A0A8K0H5N6_9ROSA|nr:hypothetical protein FNV43_RR11267 [Rhamnella rubrinervis]
MMNMEKITSMVYNAALEESVTDLLELLQQDRLILDRLTVFNGVTETPLHVASLLGHTDFAKEILHQKPQLAKELDSQRSSPLHLASAKGYVEIVKALVIVSPHICFAGDKDGLNPLQLAAMKGRVDVLRELMGIAPEATRATTDQGETILHEAFGGVADKQLQTTKFLISNTKIEVNAVNANGLTALDIVAQSRRGIKDFVISECLRSGGGLRTTNAVNSPSHATGVASNKRSPFAAHDHKSPVPTQLRNVMIKDPEDWLTRKRDSLMVVASLIATMAFQAGLNPPGGLWQDDKEHMAGKSIMAVKQPDDYAYYLGTNTVGFVTSLSIILLLVTGLPFKRRFLMWVLTVIVWVTITCMALTYRTSIKNFTPQEQVRVSSRVVSYGVASWCGLMGLVFLLHTTRLVTTLISKFGNVTGNQTSFAQNLISA